MLKPLVIYLSWRRFEAQNLVYFRGRAEIESVRVPWGNAEEPVMTGFIKVTAYPAPQETLVELYRFQGWEDGWRQERLTIEQTITCGQEMWCISSVQDMQDRPQARWRWLSTGEVGSDINVAHYPTLTDSSDGFPDAGWPELGTTILV